jgi:hypothetical protein
MIGAMQVGASARLTSGRLSVEYAGVTGIAQQKRTIYQYTI